MEFGHLGLLFPFLNCFYDALNSSEVCFFWRKKGLSCERGNSKLGSDVY